MRGLDLVARGGVPLAVGAALAGCALPQSGVPFAAWTIVESSTDPMQYRSPLPRDLRGGARAPVAVKALSCRTMISFPPNPPSVFLGSNLAAQYIPWQSLSVTFGDDGYATVIARARDGAGPGRLFDVRADLHTTSVLGIWRRECIEVHALVSK